MKTMKTTNLLAHFARVSIERDAMRNQLEHQKTGTQQSVSEMNQLLHFLGMELFSDGMKLLGNVPAGDRNNLIQGRIRQLRHKAGEKIHGEKTSPTSETHT